MNSKGAWVLQIDSGVRKSLKKMPRHDAERIFDAIEQLSANPFAGDIEKMKGEKGVWRRRIGAYRIFFEAIAAEKVIHVFSVERRTSKTY